jgi:hypothetical protein
MTNRFETFRSTLVRRLLLAGLSLLFAGCETVRNYSVTSNLWETRNFSKTAAPASPANLKIFEAGAGGRLLVSYDEYSERRKKVLPPTYWLAENREIIDAGNRPNFVKISRAGSLLPLLECAEPVECTNRATLTQTSYAPAENGQSFVLCRPGLAEGPYKLPVYDERSGTPTKVALTPLAVAGDAAIVGLVVAVIAACEWVASGGH